MTELTGTEKQVSWANTIRESFVKNMNDEKMVKDLLRYNHCKAEDIITWAIETKTEAKWWIENMKGQTGIKVIKEMLISKIKMIKEESLEEKIKKIKEINSELICEVLEDEGILEVCYISKSDLLLEIKFIEV
jgi:hypothetical protein